MAKTSLKVKKMQSLRKTAFCTEEVWYLPYLLQRACIQG